MDGRVLEEATSWHLLPKGKKYSEAMHRFFYRIPQTLTCWLKFLIEIKVSNLGVTFLHMIWNMLWRVRVPLNLSFFLFMKLLYLETCGWIGGLKNNSRCCLRLLILKKRLNIFHMCCLCSCFVNQARKRIHLIVLLSIWNRLFKNRIKWTDKNEYIILHQSGTHIKIVLSVLFFSVGYWIEASCVSQTSGLMCLMWCFILYVCFWL